MLSSNYLCIILNVQPYITIWLVGNNKKCIYATSRKASGGFNKKIEPNNKVK
jgi:hypothetical protein